MRHSIPALLVSLLLAFPVAAQEQPPKEGLSLMQEGARLFMRGILDEMEPALDDLRGLSAEMEPALRQFVQDMAPALQDLMGKIDDITRYHPPEILPNGDIIMRRKPEPSEPVDPDAHVDL